MANFAVIRVSFADGIVVQAAEWDTLDGYTAAMIDGDGGGTWNPAADIVIDDAGLLPEFLGQGSLWLASPWSLGASGGVSAIAETPVGSGAKFTHGDNDYFVLGLGHTNATRSISDSLVATAFIVNGTAATGVNGAGTPAIFTLVAGTWFQVPISVHDGATLSQIAVTFNVGTTHANPPEVMPKLRVVRVDAGGVKTPLASAAQGADASGWVSFPTPASGALWYAAGAMQTWTVTLDENNVIDATDYEYFLEIVDESGASAFAAGAGNYWVRQTASYSAIADLRPQ